jgi:hypothetical protein
MSFNVTTHFVQQYTTNVQMLLQQKGSKLRDTVSVGSYTGKAAKAVEQVGPVTAQKRTTRHADTPLISTPSDARWVFPTDYEWADLIDDQDKLRMLIDPQSSYAQNGAYALGRAMDDEIIAGIFGVNKVGENGSSNVNFDTSNQRVAVNHGATGNVGLTVAKLREAKRILMKNEVDIDNEQLFVVITAKQHDDLLNEAQAISLDYNTRPVLVDGKISAFMGFNFVHCERIPATADPYRRVVAYAKSGIHLGMWNDINTMISQRDDKSYATQVYVKGTFGATRTEEKKVVDILCNEA